MNKQNKKEYDETFENAARMIAETLNITMDQARVRQLTLLNSGILDQGDPNDPISQMMIDAFLTNPAWDKQPKQFNSKS